MDSLMKRLERDGRDVARRFLTEREQQRQEDRHDVSSLQYLRGELAGLSRGVWYVTGEAIEDVEARWLEDGGTHFAVHAAQARAL